jgi:hypothetical protein
VQVGSHINQQQSRPGKDGFLLHTSLGLVGWIDDDDDDDVVFIQGIQ